MELRDFFPASAADFQERAGEVTAVTEADFEDEHKKRHLDSFKQSMTAWREYATPDAQVDPQLLMMARRLFSPEFKLADAADLEAALQILRRQYKISPSKSQLGAALKYLMDNEQAPSHPLLESLLMKRQVRTASGVAVITVLTSPGRFSCPKDCYYCPNEPGQPRSYLSTEPAVLRANQCGWDAVRQFWDRAQTLHRNGHTVDKIELLVLGGTWSGYSHEYQEEFVRDLFFAANEFPNFLAGPHTEDDALCPIPAGMRERRSLEEEHLINESATCKVIGLTLETRPDYINKFEIERLRLYGCTRVQIGVQHTNADILQYINRGCTTEQVIKAIRLLKDACFKVDIHLMPDLPSSDVVKDAEMFDTVLRHPGLQADQWKIYPCEVTPFSRIAEWYKDGIYKPYTEEGSGELDLLTLILQVKKCMHPWIRLNRVVRDIPNQSIIAGNNKTNLRQILGLAASRMGWSCLCMRCREIRLAPKSLSEGCLFVRSYDTQGGTEYFLSFETADQSQLFGFLRLRLPSQSNEQDINARRALPFEVLKDRCALVRELHVYGMLVATTGDRKEGDERHQHSGFGRSLLLAAEALSVCKGFERVAVIAGIGTRNYYRKFGYELEETFMVKTLVGAEQSIFERYHDNPLLPPRFTIHYYQIETLPSLTSIDIDQDIVQSALIPNAKKALTRKNKASNKIVINNVDQDRRKINSCICTLTLTVPQPTTTLHTTGSALLESATALLTSTTGKAILLGAGASAAILGALWYRRSKLKT